MRYLEILRAVWGLTELVSPRWTPGMFLGFAVDRKMATVIRILGARHLIQAALTYRGSKVAHRVGGTVDILHALSMLGVAAVDGKHRSPAAVSATIAIAFAVGEKL